MRSLPPQILLAITLVLIACGPARAQAPAYADSVDIAVPLTFDGTGTSAWGPISADVDSTGFRPEDPGLSLWEYPVGGLWWLIKLPFALLESGFRGLVEWWGDIPFFDTVAAWLGRLPEFGVKFRAEWTPASGFRYGVNVYEHRPLDGHLHLQYWHAGGARGDLINTGASRLFLGDHTELDLVAGYNRRGAERYFGIGPDSYREDESYFTNRDVWFGGSVQRHFDRNLSLEVRGFYSELRNRGPRHLDRFESTAEVFAGRLPLGWDQSSTGMSYEFELKRDATGTPGRGARGGVQRLLIGHFHPTSGPGHDVMQYRVDLQQFIGGHQRSGRQLALKFFYAWLTNPNGEIHFQRLMTNHDADSFRGYHDFRFRDRGITGATVEYRYPVWDHGAVGGRLGMDGYVFWDAGQVFSRHETIRLENVAHSLGVGIRLVSTDDFLARAEIAGSREDFIARLSVSQVFQRAKGGVYDGRPPIPMR